MDPADLKKMQENQTDPWSALTNAFKDISGDGQETTTPASVADQQRSSTRRAADAVAAPATGAPPISMRQRKAKGH